MICNECKQRISEGQFYQGRGWQAQHINCPSSENDSYFDYVPDEQGNVLVADECEVL